MKTLLILLLATASLTAQEIEWRTTASKKILTVKDNDTVSAKLVLQDKIIEGFVVYGNAENVETKEVYRFPSVFLNEAKETQKDVLYYRTNHRLNITNESFIISDYGSYKLQPSDIDYFTLDNTTTPIPNHIN